MSTKPQKLDTSPEHVDFTKMARELLGVGEHVRPTATVTTGILLSGLAAALQLVHDQATADEREACAAVAYDDVCGCGSNTAHLIATREELPEYSAKVLQKYRARGGA